MSNIDAHPYRFSFGPVSNYPDDWGIDAFFRLRAAERAASIAIVYGAQKISYAELDRRANRLAAYLRQRGIEHEEPIGMLLEPGPDQIASQLAVIRAGGSCLPLDPGAPDERIGFMLEDLGVRTVLTTAALRARVAARDCVLVEEQGAWLAPVTQSGHAPGPDHRTHILFTSGTTGRPKAVQVLARGIIRLTVSPHYVPLSADDRFAAIATPTFDASLFEIWGALLNGATVIVLPRQTIIDPYAFRHSLRAQGITTMFVTTTLFNQTVHACPDAFRGMRNLLVGGEVLNPSTLRAVLDTAPPERLINVYGPTECTTFSSCHVITRQDVDGRSVPIGKPIDNTQVFVLDEAKRPLDEGQVGEIFIGGDGVARGYWNRPELNEQRFVEVDGLIEGHTARLYRTGDLGSWQAGILQFHGRNDNQVKIRGHRIEVEEIEAVILASGLVRDAVVTVQETGLGDKYLMGFVVAHDATASSTPASLQAQQNAVSDLATSPLIAQVARHIETRLPIQMRPRLAQVDALPMNANGKVDRRALAQQQLGKHASTRSHTPAEETATPTGTQAVLRAIWRRTLDLETVNGDANFFDLGGDSLQAASLVLQVSRQFNHPMPVQVLYENPTPATLAHYLDNRNPLSGGFTTSGELSALLADTRLPDDIQPLAGPLEPWRAAGRGHVFMTGITGFLGPVVLSDLLHMAEVAQVACLVRAKSDAYALARIRKTMMQYGLWEEAFTSRLLPLAGDLAQGDLGLGERFDELAARIDVVFHLGAHVNYIEPYSAHKEANVTGTINVLRLVTTGRPKSLHFSSTIAAFGPAGLLESTPVVYEDDAMEHYLAGLKFNSGYSQSKWVSEQLVREAQRRGIPVSVYRPGFIMGDSRTGAGNPNDFVARLVKGCIAIGAYPLLQGQGKQFVPVDYVSEAMLRIASNDANLSSAYHLVPPRDNAPVDLIAFFALLGQSGYPLEALPYPQWVRRLSDDPALERNALMPLVPMLAEPVYGQLTRWEVYEGMPVYDTSNTARALNAAGGLAYPRFDQALLRLYLDYWTEIGFLEAAASANGHAGSRKDRVEEPSY